MKLLSFPMGLLSLLLSYAMVEAKEVVMPYDDFLQIIAKVEHKDKLLQQCVKERGILVKLNDEHGTIKKLTTEQVEHLLATVEALEKVSAKDAQIQEAIHTQLLSKTKELSKEQRLSRYKSEAVWLGILGAIMWVVN